MTFLTVPRRIPRPRRRIRACVATSVIVFSLANLPTVPLQAAAKKPKAAAPEIAFVLRPDGSGAGVDECSIPPVGCSPDPNLQFTVRASGTLAPGKTYSVTFVTLASSDALETQAGRDLPDADYVRKEVVLNFTAAQPEQTVEVRVLSDQVIEKDERVLALIRTPKGGAKIRKGGEKSYGVIRDDDGAPRPPANAASPTATTIALPRAAVELNASASQASFSGFATIKEGDPGGSKSTNNCFAYAQSSLPKSQWTGNCAVAYISVPNPSSTPIKVELEVRSAEPTAQYQSAQNGADFDGGVFGLTIPAGERFGEVLAVRIVKDTIWENPTEAFEIVIRTIDGRSVAPEGRSKLTFVIADDDPEPTPPSPQAPSLVVNLPPGLVKTKAGEPYHGFARLVSLDDATFAAGSGGRVNMIVRGQVALIGNDGSTLIGNDGSTFVNLDGLQVMARRGVQVVGGGDGNASAIVGLISVNHSRLVGNDGASLVGPDGGTLIGLDSSTLIGNDGSTLIGLDGSTLVGNDGASIRPVQPDPFGLIGNDSAGLVRSVLAGQIAAGSGLIGNDSAGIISDNGAGVITDYGLGLISNGQGILTSKIAGGLISNSGTALIRTAG